MSKAKVVVYPRSGAPKEAVIALARLGGHSTSFLSTPELSDLTSAHWDGCLEFSTIPGETIASAMARVYQTLCARFSNVRSEHGTRGLLSEQNGRRLDLSKLLGISCVPVEVQPSFRASIPISLASPVSTVYLNIMAKWYASRKGYQYDMSQHYLCLVDRRYMWPIIQDAPDDCLSVGCRYVRHGIHTPETPMWLAANAFISGGTNEGVYDALSRCVRSRISPSVSPDVFTCAYVQLIAKFFGTGKIDVPDLSSGAIRSVPISPTMSAGYFPVEPVQLGHYPPVPNPVGFDFSVLEGKVIALANTCKQDIGQPLACEMLNEIVNIIQEQINNKDYDPQWFPVLLSKISVKPEVRKAGTNVSKTRVIFIGCLIHLLLDKLLYTEFVKKTYMKNSVMIGHQWKHGGAKYAASMLAYARDDIFYVTLDVTHFDQSAFAAMISLIMLMPFFVMKDNDSAAYRTARAFVFARAHEMACKIVKWTGNAFRYIIGQVFSGLFVTSWLDTVYMVLCRLAAVIMIHNTILAAEGQAMADAFQSSAMPALQYGDNAVWAFEMRWFKYVIGVSTPARPLGVLQDHLEHSLGLTLKASETYIFLPDFAKIYTGGSPVRSYCGIGPLFTIIAPVYEEGRLMRYDVLRDGPEFLKRKFVYMRSLVATREVNSNTDPYRVFPEMDIMPWRSEDDFFTRSSISTTALETESDKWSAKFLGLLVDTMGTNAVAYDLMRSCYTLSLKGAKLTSAAISSHYNPADPFFYKVMARTGLQASSFPTFFAHIDNLYNWFTWDENWRVAWSIVKDVPLYTPRGVPYRPTWDLQADPQELLLEDPSY